MEKYSVAVTEECFHVDIPLFLSKRDNEEIVKKKISDKIHTGLKFSSWITKFFGQENDLEAVCELDFLDPSSKNLLIKSLTEAADEFDTKDHYFRIIGALEALSVSPAENESSTIAQSPTTSVPKPLSYTRDEIKNAQKTNNEDTKEQRTEENSCSSKAISDPRKSTFIWFPFSENGGRGTESGDGGAEKYPVDLENQMEDSTSFTTDSSLANSIPLCPVTQVRKSTEIWFPQSERTESGRKGLGGNRGGSRGAPGGGNRDSFNSESRGGYGGNTRGGGTGGQSSGFGAGDRGGSRGGYP